MQFQVLPKDASVPHVGKSCVYLKIDRWNDYSFVTMFSVYVLDERGVFHDVGAIKIGFKGQTTDRATYEELPNVFETLDESFFSLGQDVDFYKKMAAIPDGLGKLILGALRDIVLDLEIIDRVGDEKVFSISLLRYVSLSTIKGQFTRVLDGHAELTDYSFQFVKPSADGFDEVRLDFYVKESSIPSTNIHAIIGRNGVGKTTLLNGMIQAVIDSSGDCGFFDKAAWKSPKIDHDYFSGLISVSFSAFDPFPPPLEQSDPTKGTCYFYVGLKTPGDPDRLKTLTELRLSCTQALAECFVNNSKFERWLSAIDKLSSDEVFASMDIRGIRRVFDDLRAEKPDVDFEHGEFHDKVSPLLVRMSSGHAVVLLTITRLVARLEEKTLVLLDEPESHLHPPLLAAFLRALSDLLRDRNGVAIIATHSPVVLQEIPRSSVWKIYRRGLSIACSRPEIETFGENVGLLTSEVFGLEVSRSGFHDLLKSSVQDGGTFAEILSQYNKQIGFEGRALLGALIAERDKGVL
ncbi:AAA family ATPase [Xanthomonas campestris]|uniref:AAA family ATPase n=1 Tax=Xanthomonas campestris TaxID=339 RepID=UPI003555D256